jgi:hypothetical protein
MSEAIDYQKLIIYNIVCNDLNITDNYVGSTTNFVNRKINHKNRCRNEKDKKHHYKVYKFIRENGGFSNWEIVEIEKYPCHNAKEAVKRERYYFELLDSNLNTNFPQSTKAEWREDNKEVIAMNKKKIREDNKDILSEKSK